MYPTTKAYTPQSSLSRHVRGTLDPVELYCKTDIPPTNLPSAWPFEEFAACSRVTPKDILL